MSEEQESSVLFSLKELMSIEEDRIKAEEDAQVEATRQQEAAKVAEEARRQGYLHITIHHHPDGISPLFISCRERRVVPLNGAAPDHYSIRLPPHLVDITAGSLSGYPLRLPTCCGNPPIEGCRHLQGDIGKACCDKLVIGLIDPRALTFKDTCCNGYPGPL